jgi:hypothetical protein
MRELWRLSLAAVVGLLIALVGCKNSASGPTEDIGNLLSNGTFELNGHATFGHWALRDTPLDTMTLFQQDAPPLGGSICLVLTPRPPEASYARSYVTGITANSGIFRLTVWARAINDWPNGSVSLWKMSAGFPTVLKSTNTPAGNWTQYTLEDTLDLDYQDSLFVQLSPGFDNQTIPGTMRFDLVKLEKIR